MEFVKIAFMFIIISILDPISAAAYSADQIEWAPASEGTLYRGNSFTNGPYTVKAVEFSAPVQGHKGVKGDIVPDTYVEGMVNLELYKDGTYIKNIILSGQSGADIEDDYEVMISPSEFLSGNSREWVLEYYQPWVKVAISLRGKPKLDTTVTTDKKSYATGSDQIITATIEIKNNGDAVAKNVDVNVNTDGLKSDSQLHQVYVDIKKGETRTFEVKLSVPNLIDEKSFTLTADVKGYDVKDIEYKFSGSASITSGMKQNFYTISKGVSKDRMYLNDMLNVRLTVANSGILDMNNIVLNDTLSPNFELKSGTPLFWNIPVLHPGEWKDIEYSIKPLETSLTGFSLPSASASFIANGKQYNVSSDLPKVIVNGPKIVINKTVDKEKVNNSEEVTVRVSVINIGNIATKTEIKDTIPEEVLLVDGPTSLGSTFLEVNIPAGFNYTIKINTFEDVELPPAVANYTGVEFRGMTRSSVMSGQPVITILDKPVTTPVPTDIQDPQSNQTVIISTTTSSGPSQTETQDPTPTPVTPGLNVPAVILVLSFAALSMHRRS